MTASDSKTTQQHAAEIIVRGGVIAFRTDTFYGLGADPFNATAVRRVKELKGREDDKPILVLISNRDQLKRLVPQRNTTFDQLAKLFWPGPLTIVGKANPTLPDELTAGTNTVGVRLPDDDRVRALVRACGGALTATSANPSDNPPARTADDVERYFGDRLDLIVDGDPAKTDQPSTVIDATSPELKLIREGVIAWSRVQEELQKS